jgi:glycosyltransferase involved in cell wall biosynthesis
MSGPQAPAGGRVGIVYPRANIDTVPCLVVAAELLAEHGYEVDLLTLTTPGHAVPVFASPRVRVCSLGTTGLPAAPPPALRGAARRLGWLHRAARGPLGRSYAALGAHLAHGSRLVARARTRLATHRSAYDCLIGVDPDGLELAHTLAAGVPVAYYSLELLLSYELQTPAERQLKARERVLCRQAPFVIVQDEARGQLLAEDNGLDRQRLVLVPNAPLGPARRRPSRYWHQRFDLAPPTRVALHAGSLGEWTGIEAIVESVPRWPAPWVLVIHTRYDAESSAYVERLRARADPRRVRFSLKPVARQTYDELVDGADAGLAFYIPTGESAFTQRNIQTIGLSSGKLAYLLRAGVPVISNAGTSMAPLLAAAGCGVAVGDARQIGAALEQIEADADGYSRRACAFFDRCLDPRPAFGEVVRRLDGLRVVA